MTQQHHNTMQPVPSSILHNSTDVRAQYTRVAARQAADIARKNLQTLYRQIRSKKLFKNPAGPAG